MFIANPHMWNEDIGETCFGILSRAISNQPNKSTNNWVQEQYMLIKPLIASVGDLTDDSSQGQSSGILPKCGIRRGEVYCYVHEANHQVLCFKEGVHISRRSF
jgi:hypothetical protein